MAFSTKRNVFLLTLAAMGGGLLFYGGVLSGAVDLGAIRRYFGSVQHPVEDTELLYTQAVERFKWSDNFNAKLLARRIVALEPNNFEGWKMLAAIAMREKDYALAEQYLLKALKINPNDLTAQTALGLAMRAQGKSMEAISAFRRILLNPETQKEYRDEANYHLLQMEKELRDLAAKDAVSAAALKSITVLLHGSGPSAQVQSTPEPPPAPSRMTGITLFATPSPAPIPKTSPTPRPVLDVPDMSNLNKSPEGPRESPLSRPTPPPPTENKPDIGGTTEGTLP